MLQIWINGEPRDIPDGTTVESLLELLQLTQGKVAVERNEEVIVAKQRPHCLIAQGDRIEIVTFVGGG